MKTIELPTQIYTKVEDLIRINDELADKANKGELLPLRMDKDKIMIAEPSINGIWTLFLDKGNIVKIVLV